MKRALECAGIAASDLVPAAAAGASGGRAAEGAGITAAATGADQGDGSDVGQRPQGACLVDAVCSMVGAEWGGGDGTEHVARVLLLVAEKKHPSLPGDGRDVIRDVLYLVSSPFPPCVRFYV